MNIKGSKQHSFAVAPQADIPRSTFNRSFNIKTSFNASYLIPLWWDEVLPGDTFRAKMQLFCRFSTLLFPLMDNVYLDVHYFYIPNRLVWDNWVKMCGEQDAPGDSTDFTVPVMTAPVGGYAEGSVFDYMGLPTKVAGFEHISLPLRALNLVFNTWYRDENLVDPVTVNKGDASDPDTDYGLYRRGKRRDYFTSCLPWPQKGVAVELPLGTSAPVYTSSTPGISGAYPGISFNQVSGAALGASNIVTDASGVLGVDGVPPGGAITQIYPENLYADLANATAATINSLRQAFQIQRMYERDARGGSRYIETLYAHYKVTAPDFRLQRPEYLGGTTAHMNITAIPQSAPTTGGSTPQGNLAAIGTLACDDHGFTKSFVEHGILLCIISARSDLTYQSGLNRMWSRTDRFSYYWPALSHLGEQAVLNKEIYTQGTSADDNVFGYQERYAEYRYYPSMITGLFRSNATGTLDSWHLAQDFSALPVLGDTFIEENVPTSRVKAVNTEPDFLLDGRVDLVCARPMPVYSVPGLIDHF